MNLICIERTYNLFYLNSICQMHYTCIINFVMPATYHLVYCYMDFATHVYLLRCYVGPSMRQNIIRGMYWLLYAMHRQKRRWQRRSDGEHSTNRRRSRRCRSYLIYQTSARRELVTGFTATKTSVHRNRVPSKNDGQVHFRSVARISLPNLIR